MSLQEQARGARATHWADGDVSPSLARVLAIVALVLPILGIAYILVRLVRQVGGSASWRRTDGPARSAAPWPCCSRRRSSPGSAGPGGRARTTYRPIAAYEGGTARQRPAAALRHGAAAAGVGRGHASDRSGRTTPTGPTAGPARARHGAGPAGPADGAEPAPTPPARRRTQPTRATRRGSRPRRRPDGSDRPAPETADRWVFPFDRPLPPGGGGQPGARGQHHRRHGRLRRRLRPGLGRRRRPS